MCQHIIIIASHQHRSNGKLHDVCIIRIRVELIAFITPKCIINCMFIYDTHTACFFFGYMQDNVNVFHTTILHHRFLHDHHN